MCFQYVTNANRGVPGVLVVRTNLTLPSLMLTLDVCNYVIQRRSSVV
ncbi:hypothetical protein MTBUT4_120053 [Magnetospirillum sp. UT-4]|nr:hypothetical protein MTBUT4_120053 [Magnetospirillum sp. UT-4]